MGSCSWLIYIYIYISRTTRTTTHIGGLITPVITTHEPPARTTSKKHALPLSWPTRMSRCSLANVVPLGFSWPPSFPSMCSYSSVEPFAQLDRDRQGFGPQMRISPTRTAECNSDACSLLTRPA